MQIIHTEKFSDTSILIRTLFPLSKEIVTRLNLLVYMMRAKTKKFDTKQKLSMALSSTYGMHVSYGISGYGKQLAFDVRFKYIREDYIQKDEYLAHVIEIMKEVLYEAILDDSTLQEAKYLLKAKLKNQQDDPDAVAIKNALVNAQKDHEIGIQIQGYIEDVDLISLEQMQQAYRMYQKQNKCVYVCGHVCDEMESFLRTIPELENLTNEYSLIEPQPCAYSLDRWDISQSSLVQVYASKTPMDDALYYPLLVMNSMLGQCPMNLLFEEIREKKSYCYSISSNLIRFDGALVIMVGTNCQNIDDVQSLIDVQIDRLIHADVDEELISIAKSDLIDMIQAQQDQASSMMEQKFLDCLLKRTETNEDRIKRIEQVTMEQIQQVASRLSLVSVSIVEEENDEL